MKKWKWIFFWNEFGVNKETMTQEEIQKHKNLLYTADLDYLSARKLYLSGKVFYFPFLTHASQTFEKYLKFISYFLYSNEAEKKHSSNSIFANTDFFQCIDAESTKIIQQLLDQFVWYRYLDSEFSIDVLKVINTLDKFILEYYKTLSSIWILWFANVTDDIIIKLGGYDWIPTNIVSRLYTHRDLEWFAEYFDISILKRDNIYFEETCSMFDKHIKTPTRITFTWWRIIRSTDSINLDEMK
jgi:hypothetical protein